MVTMGVGDTEGVGEKDRVGVLEGEIFKVSSNVPHKQNCV